MIEKIKKAADHIIWKYMMGHYSQSEAHTALTELNGCCFSMYDFGLAVFDPGETQEYIHTLQDKYTTERV